MRCYADCPHHDSCSGIVENCSFPMYLAAPPIKDSENGLDYFSWMQLIVSIGIVSILIIIFTLVYLDMLSGVK